MPKYPPIRIESEKGRSGVLHPAEPFYSLHTEDALRVADCLAGYIPREAGSSGGRSLVIPLLHPFEMKGVPIRAVKIKGSYMPGDGRAVQTAPFSGWYPEDGTRTINANGDIAFDNRKKGKPLHHVNLKNAAAEVAISMHHWEGSNTPHLPIALGHYEFDQPHATGKVGNIKVGAAIIGIPDDEDTRVIGWLLRKSPNMNQVRTTLSTVGAVLREVNRAHATASPNLENFSISKEGIIMLNDRLFREPKGIAAKSPRRMESIQCSRNPEQPSCNA